MVTLTKGVLFTDADDVQSLGCRHCDASVGEMFAVLVINGGTVAGDALVVAVRSNLKALPSGIVNTDDNGPVFPVGQVAWG